MWAKKVVPVKGHVRKGVGGASKGDVAVSPHDRPVPGRTVQSGVGDGGDFVALQSLREGLGGIAEDQSADVPVGYVVIEGQLVPTCDFTYDMMEQEAAPLSLRNKDLRGLRFSGLVLNGADFSGSNLEGATFENCRVYDANFSGCNLTDVTFDGVLSSGTIFDNANLNGFALRGSTLSRLSADGVDLGEKNIFIRGSYFEIGKLCRVPNLEKAGFEGASIKNIDWSGMDLTSGDLRGVDRFDACRFDGAVLDGMRFEGVTLHDCHLNDASCVGADFSDATISFMTARKADFGGAMFERADVMDSHFAGSNFHDSDWVQASALATSFQEGNFSDSSFIYVKVGGCYFEGASFAGADLTGTDFTEVETSDVLNISGRQGNGMTSCNQVGMTLEAQPAPYDTITSCYMGGVNWSGVKLDHVKFHDSWVVAGEKASDPKRIIDVTTAYDLFTAEQSARILDLDMDEFGVMVWGGLLEARDNRTKSVVQGTINMKNLHVPVWAIEGL